MQESPNNIQYTLKINSEIPQGLMLATTDAFVVTYAIDGVFNKCASNNCVCINPEDGNHTLKME